MYRSKRDFWDGKKLWKKGETSPTKAHEFMEPTKAEAPAEAKPEDKGEPEESYNDLKKRAYDLRDKLLANGRAESEVEITDRSEEALKKYIETMGG